MRFLKLTCLLLAISLTGNAQIKWPENKKAVIVLTYDDALQSQLQIAIPQLDKQNLKATFFLDGRISEADMSRWTSASSNGHELANHTLYHPCSRNAFKSHERLYSETYDSISILQEIKMMNKLLFMIDGKQKRTYAYPCTETSVGGKNYVRHLTSSGAVQYSRIGGSQNAIVNDFKKLDPMLVPSFGVAQDQRAHSLIEYVEQVRRSGGLGIFMFHGVGGDYISVTAEDHQKLVDYLSQNKNDIWVTTFMEAMDHIRKQQGIR